MAHRKLPFYSALTWVHQPALVHRWAGGLDVIAKFKLGGVIWRMSNRNRGQELRSSLLQLVELRKPFSISTDFRLEVVSG